MSISANGAVRRMGVKALTAAIILPQRFYKRSSTVQHNVELILEIHLIDFEFAVLLC